MRPDSARPVNSTIEGHAAKSTRITSLTLTYVEALLRALFFPRQKRQNPQSVVLFTQSAFCFAQKNARPEQRAPQAFVIAGMRKNFGDVTRKNTRHPSPSFRPRPIEASVGGSCVGGSISAPPTSFVLAVSAAKVLCRKTLICEPESSRLGQSDGLRSLRQKRCGHNAEGLLSKAPIPPLVVEWRLLGDTVEKLDFLSRSQFLGQQAGFKKNALSSTLAKIDRVHRLRGMRNIGSFSTIS